MNRHELLIAGLDDHITTLRILALRFAGADRIEKRTSLLAPDWRTAIWYDSLWLFELEGIRASGYPAVFDDAGTAEYATPSKFSEIVARTLRASNDSGAEAWESIEASVIELDPRYVAFRTMHDWIVLSAKVLAERGDVFHDDELIRAHEVKAERGDPFKVAVRIEDDDDEPVGPLCGNPREMLVYTRFCNSWMDDFGAPDWRRVERPWEAIRYFHCNGLVLPAELRYGEIRGGNDPRLKHLELLRPEVFQRYVTDVLTRGDDAVSASWRVRGVEDVRRDPRFIAQKCGFDTQIILHICREAMKGRECPEHETEVILDAPGDGGSGGSPVGVPRTRPRRHRR